MYFRKKITLIQFTFILISLCFFQTVNADGVIYVKSISDISDWSLQGENSQTSFINYENKYENMIISITINNLTGEKAVWIFPVPSKPEDITVDIFKTFPELNGYDIKGEAKDASFKSFDMMRSSQLYPLIPLLYPGNMLSIIDSLERKGSDTGITIYGHVEKMGLTTELIKSKNSDALYNYLQGKGLDLFSESKIIFDEYAEKDYSFVISWVSDIDKFNQGGEKNQLAVSIKFPTDRIYFPLRPTSVYGEIIPITVYVLSHVTPQIYYNIESLTTVEYFVDRHYRVPEELSAFFNNKAEINKLKYTKIRIMESSKYFDDDLWMDTSAPISIAFADIIYDRWIWSIPLFILISCISSFFAGMIVFRGDIISKKNMILLGLSNFLTLIGLAIISYWMLTTFKFKGKNIAAFILSLSFIVLFSIIFMASTHIFQTVLNSILEII